MTATVTVIIPTTCELRRKEQLAQAIASIQQQKNVNAQILLVVNGQRFDPDMLAELRGRTDLKVEYREEGNLPKALVHGRRQVTTDYFCFLDDDDWLLEHSLDMRVQALERDASLDVAVTNGYNVFEQRREIRVRHTTDINTQPLLALIAGNWLASCGGLFRTSTIGAEYFEGLIKFYEWTLLAFRLCQERKILFINEPTFAIRDTPGSLSKSSDFVLSDEALLRLMLAGNIPDEARQALRRKLTGTLHTISEHLLDQGHYWRAWEYHLKSLFYPGGLVFLPYTRRLLWPVKR